jgi:hypothetical protein
VLFHDIDLLGEQYFVFFCPGPIFDLLLGQIGPEYCYCSVRLGLWSAGVEMALLGRAFGAFLGRSCPGNRLDRSIAGVVDDIQV